MNEALRTQFPLGCRVRFNRQALVAAQVPLRRDVPAVVVGYSAHQDYVWLIREGNTSREPWDVAFLARLED